ncbi:MAG: hypothetical protein KDC98_01565 [Planctomycetes bacterium]|nr:hypothetical protein [Planctomycetota bacterium]
MSHDRELHPADQRLLDAALQQLLRARPAPALATPTPAPVERTRRTPLLTAALFLFGLSITAMMLLQAKNDRAAPAQPTPTQPLPTPIQDREPSPLPPSVTAKGRAELEGLPDDTVNLVLWPHALGDLKLLPRLRALRRLQIVVPSSGTGGKLAQLLVDWKRLPDDTLAPLADLPALECLGLPSPLHLRADLLTPLQRCPRLCRLDLVGENVVIGDDLVAAMAALPGLRALALDIVTLDGKAMRRLATLPLTELEIRRCPAFDAEAFEALCSMRSLESLVLQDLGRRDFYGGDGKGLLWRATAADLEKLARLPQLRTLRLQSCAIGTEELQALPTGLHELQLRATDLDADGYRELRRFGELRHLDISTAKHSHFLGMSESLAQQSAKADALAEALGTMRLRSLSFDGYATAALLEQLALQPDLARLELRLYERLSLEPLAGMRQLREFELFQNRIPSTLTLDDLEPLRTCTGLRQLTLRLCNSELEAKAIEKLLGHDVEVRLHVTRFKEK